jgi:hypothetical protein
MDSSLQYFCQISIFGPSFVALCLVLAADILFTGVHIWQEWKEEEYPLYRAFGAIVGFWFPRRIGFALFTVGLAIIQWLVGIFAYTGWPVWLLVCDIQPIRASIGALGFVLGARVGDSIISHWLLDLTGYRPNPGLFSTALYVLEAFLIIFCFRRGLALQSSAAWNGILLGFGFFLLVLPGMALLRSFIESSQRVRWIPGEPIPDWAVKT